MEPVTGIRPVTPPYQHTNLCPKLVPIPPKPPINTSTFASIVYLGTQFSKLHVPKCIKLIFSVNLFLS